MGGFFLFRKQPGRSQPSQERLSRQAGIGQPGEAARPAA